MLHDEDEEILTKLIELVKQAGFIINKRRKEQMMQRYIGERNALKGKDLLILNCRKSE